MAGTLSRDTWERVARLRRLRLYRNTATLGLALLGPALAGLTFAVMGPFAGATSGGSVLRLVLLADLLYLIVLTGLVVARMARIVAARRKSAAGSRLHMRLVGVFATIALVPTVLVALFAGLTVNIGLEGWFSNRVQQVVSTSLSAAEAYQDEHRRDLTNDAKLLAGALTQAARQNPMLDDGDLRLLLSDYQSQIQRGLREAYIVDGRGTIRARGERSYQFWYEEPSPAQFDEAAMRGLVLIEDWQNNEFRALVPLVPLADRYLYVTRDVDGSLLGLLDDTRQTVGEYQRLEQERGRVLFEFSLLYLGFALLLVAAAMWLGLWFADRLSRPIGRLAEASEQVGEGNLDFQIPAPDTGDEIQTLGESFNRMTRQLKQQRQELVESYRAADDQRRLFDSVLSSVTAGVIGLDAAGEIDFLNRSAARLLGLDPAAAHDRLLSEAVPEFAPLFERLAQSVNESVQDEIRLTREGRVESLLVRMAIRRGAAGGLEGYVVALDDVTDLVSAQRMAAWGDVARRVAHEIKNPLTPIQLSAERLKRKFGPIAGEEREALEQYTEVIIRQTNDLRRIVDEFSRFARMPEPDRKETDIAKLLRDAELMQRDALQGALISDIPDEPVIVDADAGMMRQVFTNLLKNAGEALDELRANPPEGWVPQVRVSLRSAPDAVTIRIADNGPGLPQDRTRLFEPYVTMKPGGTGLGLPIVKKIVEEHGGSLMLTDTPEGRGAMAEIRLPRERQPVRLSARRQKNEQEAMK
ncbi:ATP-binding protein [Paracoccus sp. P2]|uniref:histidine kinase n=1 Tax=Paracoccus pantotrophus TaxID=82367 RepID=A0A7H9BUE4_PARPN|nr:PAS domain-containing sensor histidine kinase [Paracoccus pantotrophus]QLH13511.1 PAS domain-containing sensor histidine kinase [Paracoccus pantotrophus]RDD96046.1 PAS domain-containing sensor histidine kinase [Paracoccus pantotrophus]WGR67273.1 PAS domain-containing sensor histidine kinase [Paracoccus pantotrophus]